MTAIVDLTAVVDFSAQPVKEQAELENEALNARNAGEKSREICTCAQFAVL